MYLPLVAKSSVYVDPSTVLNSIYREPNMKFVASIPSLLFFFIFVSLNVNATNSIDQAALNEELGIHQSNRAQLRKSLNSVTKRNAVSAAKTTRLLLIPEATNDRIMAFDPISGDLLDADFIPSDTINMSVPIHAILSAGGDSILVSDQFQDVVLEYSLSGQFMGVFAPKGGADIEIMDNIRGIVLRDNGNLLVTVSAGTNADAVVEFDKEGNYLGNFISNGAGGLDSPFALLKRGSEYLVSGSTSDNVLVYSESGEFQSEFVKIDGFPEQLAIAANGNILVANFSGTQEGIVELTSDGSSVIGISNPVALVNYRGVFELPNQNYLVTTGEGVFEIDRSGNLIDTKISGVSARFIQLVTIKPEGADELCVPIKASNGRLAVVCL